MTWQVFWLVLVSNAFPFAREQWLSVQKHMAGHTAAGTAPDFSSLRQSTGFPFIFRFEFIGETEKPNRGQR